MAGLDHRMGHDSCRIVLIYNTISILLPRFHTYETQTMPIIEHYQKQGLVRKIQAIKSPDEVRLSKATFQSSHQRPCLTVADCGLKGI